MRKKPWHGSSEKKEGEARGRAKNPSLRTCHPCETNNSSLMLYESLSKEVTKTRSNNKRFHQHLKYFYSINVIRGIGLELY
jgi:hypothetical protein